MISYVKIEGHANVAYNIIKHTFLWTFQTVVTFLAAPAQSDQSIVPGAVCRVHSPVNGLNVCWAVINNLRMTNYQRIFEQVFWQSKLSDDVNVIMTDNESCLNNNIFKDRSPYARLISMSHDTKTALRISKFANPTRVTWVEILSESKL